MNCREFEELAEPTTITRILTIIFPTVITLWLVEMNILVLRKAPALERAITQDPQAEVSG